jgi:hypothetical protein
MSETISNNLEKLTAIFAATDQALSEWVGDGNLQFPVLLGMIAVRMQWNEKQVRDADPFVRFHVRNHPEWHVTRGAHGGIMRRSDKDKKEALRLAKELAKKQMSDALEAKAAEAIASSAASNSSSEE